MLSQEIRELETENYALKKAIKELEKNFDDDGAKPKACQYCKFYLQHYVYSFGKYTETYCGHCTHGRNKDRKPDQSCQYFEIGTPDMKWAERRVTHD